MVPALRLSGLLIGIAVFLPPAPASAYEDLHTLDVGAGYTSLPGTPSSAHSLGVALGYGVGVGDAWSLRGRATLMGGLTETASLSRFASTLSLDAIYLVDIVQLVPILGAGIGVRAGWGDALRLDPSLDAFAGLDYLIDREIYIGAEYRLSWMPLWDVAEVSQLSHTVELRFGWRLER